MTTGLVGSQLNVSEASATQTGTYTVGAPYNFSQLVKEVTSADWVIGFRPDTNGTRQEIIVYKGSLYSHSTVNEGAYTITVKRNDVQVGSVINVPNHWYRSRFRLVYKDIGGTWERVTTLPHRASAVDAATLIASKHLPPFGESGIDLNTYSYTPVAYTIMGTAGLSQYMRGVGEVYQIGAVTEHQARGILNLLSATGGNTNGLTAMWEQAEASGSVPWHYRDEATRKPVNVITGRPNITTHENQTGDPDYVEPAPSSGWTADTAHMPALAYVPFLFTRDLYLLEELQAATTWILAYYDFTRSNGYGAQLQGNHQERGFAWGLRNLFQCAEFSPATDTTGVLLDASHFTTIIDNTHNWFVATLVNGSANLYTLFRATGEGLEQGYKRFSPWEGSYLSVVLGWAIGRGWTDWNDVLDWKLQQLTHLLGGTTEWPRMVMPYKIPTTTSNGVTELTSWTAAYDTLKAANIWLEGSPGPFPDRSPEPTVIWTPSTDGPLDYPLHARGALIKAIELNKSGMQALYNFYHPKIVAQALRRGPKSTNSDRQAKWAAWVPPAA